MTGMLKDWLVGLTCAAMALALIEGLVPSGTVKKVCRLAGGLALLLAAVSPLVKLDKGAVGDALKDYRSSLDAYEETLAEQYDQRYKTIIAERTAAYIVDKAAEMGVSCQVEVTIGYDGNKLPCPREVTARGAWTPGQREAFSRMLEEDLGVPPERQRFEESTP